MSLYLSPPTGTVQIHKLEEYATKRLQFLLRLVACNNKHEVQSVLEDANVVDQSDCLITNTAKDEISHYILRLTLGGDQESKSFFCDSELALFKLRIESMVVNEWTIFFKSVEKFLHKLEGSVFGVRLSALSDLRLVFEILKGKYESWYQLSTDVCGMTANVSVSIPFQLVLRLVAQRLVNVVKGMAAVPVTHLKEVFIELFEKWLVTASRQASVERELAMRDERLRWLAARLKGLLRAETKPLGYRPRNFPALKLADLWAHSVVFPPCMANVVKVLQEEHTLKHQDRVQLTLFLKELGLPVNDALLLWKREYSVPARSSTSRHGQHRWQGNERRYIYNIRHLYGLEGSRTNYRAHGCSAIQGRALTCGDAGGCPFVSPDLTALKLSFLNQGINKDSADQILKLCHRKMYGYACQSLVLYKLKQAGKIQNDFILDERNMKIEIQNSRNKSVKICDSNINTCQERAQYNGIIRKRMKCVARSDLHSCEKMLPYGQAKNFAVKSEINSGTEISPAATLAGSSLNINSHSGISPAATLAGSSLNINSHMGISPAAALAGSSLNINSHMGISPAAALAGSSLNINSHSGISPAAALAGSSLNINSHMGISPAAALAGSSLNINSHSGISPAATLAGSSLNINSHMGISPAAALAGSSLNINSHSGISPAATLAGSSLNINSHSGISPVAALAGSSLNINSGMGISPAATLASNSLNINSLSGISPAATLAGSSLNINSGMGISPAATLAGNSLNLHNEMTLLKPALPISYTHSVTCHGGSNSCLVKGVSLNGDCRSVNSKKEHVIYGRKKYLFKMGSKNRSEGLSQKRRCSNIGNCDRSMTSKERCFEVDNKTFSSSRRLANHTPNKLVGQQQGMNSSTEASQDRLSLASDRFVSSLHVYHSSRFSKCRTQAEMSVNSLDKQNQGSVNSDVGQDCSIKTSNGISVSALVGVTSRLSDPAGGERLSSPIEGKWLLGPVEGKRLSDPVEGVRLSGPAEGRWLSGPVEGKRLSGPSEGKWLSGPVEGKWLLGPTEGKSSSDPAERRQLSVLDEGKWLSHPTKGEQLSGLTESKLLSNPKESKWLLDLAEGKWLADPTDGKWLADPTDGKWLADPGKGEMLQDPSEAQQLSYVNIHRHEYQTRCPAGYNNLVTGGNAQPTSDALREGKPAGLIESKADAKFLCERNQSGEMLHVVNESIKRHKGSLLPHTLAESTVSIKKPRDIYWFSRDYLCHCCESDS